MSGSAQRQMDKIVASNKIGKIADKKFCQLTTLYGLVELAWKFRVFQSNCGAVAGMPDMAKCIYIDTCSLVMVSSAYQCLTNHNSEVSIYA